MMYTASSMKAWVDLSTIHTYAISSVQKARSDTGGGCWAELLEIPIYDSVNLVNTLPWSLSSHLIRNHRYRPETLSLND